MVMLLVARLHEQADRREAVINAISEFIPDARDLARQDVADLREAARLLGGRVH